MTTETTPEEVSTIKLPGTPKPWMNRAVMAALKTPGLGSLLGRTFMILTVTGAKTGTRYSTPVQYVQDGHRLLVLSQRRRLWWRNIRTRPAVELLLKGRTVRTRARLLEGSDAGAAIATCFRLDPRMAKFYGLETDPDGVPTPRAIRQVNDGFVVISIDHTQAD